MRITFYVDGIKFHEIKIKKEEFELKGEIILKC